MPFDMGPRTQQDAETARYYSERASYYERVYQKPERQPDLRQMEAYLTQAFVGRRVLEVACGTGWWTPFGALRSESWLATDLNQETIEIAKQKMCDGFNSPAHSAISSPHPACGTRFGD